MPLTKIALIGANGTLGPHILNSLLNPPTHLTNPHNTPPFKVTILTRQSSKSSYNTSSTPNLQITQIPDSLTPHSSLVSALRNHDVLILSLSGSQTSNSLKLIDAAVEAGVSRIIPADFGSCDSSDPRSLSLLPLYNEKKKVREYLVDLAENSRKGSSSTVVSWTSLVNGHFLDYGLRSGLMMLDVDGRKARVFDGGDKMFSASMLRTVGDAVVGILRHPEETRDRVVYVQSIRTCQNELVRVVEGVVGGDGFEVESWDSDQFIRRKQEELRRKPGDHELPEELVGVEGIVNADWEAKEGGLGNELFGLREESLVDLVRESLKM